MSGNWKNGLLLSTSILALGCFEVRAQQIPLEPIIVRTPLDGTVITTTRANPQTTPRQAPPSAATPTGSPQAGSAAQVQALAVQAPTAIDVLAGASAVSRGQVDEQFQSDGVADVLRTIPGVTVQTTARDTGVAVNIRGLQDFGRVNVLVDGMRQNFQRSGHSSNGVAYIEPEMIKRVDVTRGPTATVYGSGAIGGVAAFEVIDADDVLESSESVGMRLKSRYSTNGAGPFGSATAAFRIGNFDMIGQLNGRDIDDYRDGGGNRIEASGEKTESALMRGRWRSHGHQVAGTFIDYQSHFIDAAATTPSTTLPVTLTRRDSDLHNQQYNMSYGFTRPDAPLIDFSAKVYRNETDLVQRKLNNSFAGTQRGFNLVTEGVDVSNTSRFDFGGTRLALTYGADAFKDTVVTFDQDPGGNADELTPGGQRQVSGAFAQSQFKFWSHFDFIGAVRYDSYSLDGATTQLEGSRISPKATLGVTPIKGLTVYGTYAEGYRAPAITESLVAGFHPGGFAFRLLPNPNLRPEVAHNLEAGVNLKYDGIFDWRDAFRAKVSVFQNKVDDFIAGVYSPLPPPFGQFQYQNIANATLEGVELEAAYDARIWFLGLAASRIRGTNDATGLPIDTIPADKVTLTAGLRTFNDRLVTGARLRMASAQDRVTTASLATDGYAVADIFAQYQHAEGITFNLNVDNIFDKNYRQFLDQSNSAGLNARIGVTMRFGQ